jgi:hypothetical protein
MLANTVILMVKQQTREIHRFCPMEKSRTTAHYALAFTMEDKDFLEPPE